MQSSIKLALLGRANSGKKTVAKQLKEVLGPDVAIMNIDEMVREAIEYISPKKAEEQV
jgi:dephospho-CoA kinase